MTSGEAGSRPRITLGAACLAVAWVAVGLGLALQPMVLFALNPDQWAYGAIRFAWLWVGFALVAARGRTMARRFLGFGGVLVGSIALMIFFPHLDIGREPDIPGYLNVAFVLATLMLAGAAGVAALCARSP